MILLGNSIYRLAWERDPLIPPNPPPRLNEEELATARLEDPERPPLECLTTYRLIKNKKIS